MDETDHMEFTNEEPTLPRLLGGDRPGTWFESIEMTAQEGPIDLELTELAEVGS